MALPNNPPAPRREIQVLLTDLKNREAFPERTIQLQPPEYEISIGRGSHTEPHLYPKEANAWFTSRVMSREHAVLRADPKVKQLYLEDTGSMHGTYIEGTKLQPNLPVHVAENQKIQFGSEIVRGDQTYKPLEITVFIDWNENLASAPLVIRPDPITMPRNSFSVDFSEEDHDIEDDDVEVVYQTIRARSLEIDRPSKTFSVPDSDISDTSDVGKHHEETSLSSLGNSPELSLKSAHKPTFATSANTPKILAQRLSTTVPGSTFHNALNVSDDEEEVQVLREKLAERVADNENNVEDVEDDEHDYYSEDDDEMGSRNSDINDRSDMGEESTFDDGTRNQRRAGEEHAATETAPRDPSPSDAAMPKALWYPSHNLPAIHHIVDPVPMMFGNSCPTESFQPPLPFYSQPLCSFPGMNWTNEDNNHNFPEQYDQGYVAPALIQPGISQDRTEPTIREDGADKASVQSAKPLLPTRPMTRAESPTKPSKVSINDIIDKVQPDHTPTNGNRKRKIEEISTVTIPDQPVETIHRQGEIAAAGKDIDVADGLVLPTGAADSTTSGASPEASCEMPLEKHTPVKKTVSFSPEAVVIGSEVERPMKKARLQEERQGGSVMKYVAATVAGMTLGAVGTVFGLAALPADYFL